MTTRQALQEWRKRHDITRTQVGAEAGVSERTVYRWETDESLSGPGVVELQRLEARWPGLIRALGLGEERAS